MKHGHAIAAFILIIVACACHQDQYKHRHKNHKTKFTNSDTLFVTKRSAVSVWLDSTTLEKRKKQYGDEGYAIGLDDDMFYTSISDSVLIRINCLL